MIQSLYAARKSDAVGDGSDEGDQIESSREAVNATERLVQLVHRRRYWWLILGLALNSFCFR